MKKILSVILLCCGFIAIGQPHPLFRNLPVGPYPVGFSIFTIRDDSRVTKSRYNFLGEKDTTNLERKITMHLWYPAARGNSNGQLTYADYCYNDILRSTVETVDNELRKNKINSQRESFQNFFGKLSDSDWVKLSETKFLSYLEAPKAAGKFPLLLGMLRPLSTSVTNEMLASNGYVVAMIKQSGIQYPRGFSTEIEDLQHAMAFLIRAGMVDGEKIGAFGFSGSGFTPLVFAMHDPRIRAVADIESGFFMEDLNDWVAKSDYYHVRNLRVPFLHLFSKVQAVEEVHFDQFEAMKFADRYHVVMNAKGFHHWDFATEGRASTTVVQVRGEKGRALAASFELSQQYLLHFFNATLKQSRGSVAQLQSQRKMSAEPDSLWRVDHYSAVSPPPDDQEFEMYITRKGADAAIALAREILVTDSVAEFAHENQLNEMAQGYAAKGDKTTAIKLMEFAVDVHPQAAWVWNNLAGLQEEVGDVKHALHSSQMVLTILKDYQGSEQAYNERVRRRAAERISRLDNNP